MREKLISLSRVADESRALIFIHPANDVKMYSSPSGILLSKNNESYQLTPTDSFIWALITKTASLQDIELETMKKLELDMSYLNFIREIIISFYRLKLVSLDLNGVPVTISSWREGAIRTVHFSVTSKCNLRCIHCLVAPSKEKELSTNEILSCLKQLANIGVEYLNFSGGEICVRPDAEKILGVACSLDFVVSMNTNATLVDIARAKDWKQKGIRSVSVSLYSGSASTHDTVTAVNGSFDKTIRGIHALLEAGIEVIVKTMVLRNNVHELDSVARLASDLGCPVFFDGHVLPRHDGSKNPLLCALDDNDYKNILSGRLPKKPNISRLALYPICSAGQDRLAIGTHGELFPCAVFRMQIGSSRSGAIATQIKKSTLLQTFIKKGIPDIGECSKCSKNKSCNICPGVAYSETGDYLSISNRACQTSQLRKFC